MLFPMLTTFDTTEGTRTINVTMIEAVEHVTTEVTRIRMQTGKEYDVLYPAESVLLKVKDCYDKAMLGANNLVSRFAAELKKYAVGEPVSS